MSKINEQAKDLRKLWSSFQAARVLLTANNYKVFNYLKEQKTARELAKNVRADRRATEILLDALTGLGLLRKKEDRYENSRIASKFLVSDSPYYQGDIIKHADNLWNNWSGLDKVFKTGTPYHKSEDHDAFILGMHNLAVLKARDIVKAIGLKGIRKALDLGGGPGTYAMEIAKKGIYVILFDAPGTIKIARHFINKKGIKNIDFIKGDFLYDDFGKGYDLIFISQVLHIYSEKDNITLLKRCQKALSSNGKIVIQEFFIHKDRTQPVQSALFSVNMLVNTERGRVYSPDEIKEWCLRSGFKGIKRNIISDSILITARV